MRDVFAVVGSGLNVRYGPKADIGPLIRSPRIARSYECAAKRSILGADGSQSPKMFACLNERSAKSRST
jgi:hypothetical protein